MIVKRFHNRLFVRKVILRPESIAGRSAFFRSPIVFPKNAKLFLIVLNRVSDACSLCRSPNFSEHLAGVHTEHSGSTEKQMLPAQATYECTRKARCGCSHVIFDRITV